MTERIVEGPFKDFLAEATDIDPDTGEVTALVDVFGRPTPVRIPPSGLGGGEEAGVRQPRRPTPSGGELAAAVEPDV